MNGGKKKLHHSLVRYSCHLRHHLLNNRDQKSLDAFLHHFSHSDEKRWMREFFLLESSSYQRVILFNTPVQVTAWVIEEDFQVDSPLSSSKSRVLTFSMEVFQTLWIMSWGCEEDSPGNMFPFPAWSKKKCWAILVVLIFFHSLIAFLIYNSFSDDLSHREESDLPTVRHVSCSWWNVNRYEFFLCRNSQFILGWKV